MMRSWMAALVMMTGCTGATPVMPSGGMTEVPTPSDTPSLPPSTGVCTYPDNPVRPMEVGQVLFPYSWPDARDLASGVQTTLDLGNVPCAMDPGIDWSPFDVLLFVSIPAW